MKNVFRFLILSIFLWSVLSESALAQLSTAPIPVKYDSAGNIGVKPPVETNYVLADLNVGDEKVVFGTCDDGEFYVGFQLFYDLGDKNTQNLWKETVIIALLKNGTEQWRDTLHNEMALQIFTETVFHEETILCTENYSFKLISKEGANTPPEGNIFIRQKLYKKDQDVFNPYQSFNLTASAGSFNNEYLLDWDSDGTGVEEYELQWVYIDSLDDFTGVNGAAAFSFKEGTGINTAANYYQLNAYYPGGQLWFRVRSIGVNPDYPDYRIPGEWQYASSPLTITNHAIDKNWQVVNTYAEGGKAKNVMRYLDGSLRERQLLTNLNTEENIMIAESLYDFEGRPVVNILPAPVQARDLNYRSGFNEFEEPTGWGYADKFHYDNYLTNNSLLDSASGASKYYSSNNDFSTIHRDLIPQANGYAYSQTSYLNDNTGRVRKQSGVGDEFNLDNGKTTRQFYASAAREELVRLFGSNVGNTNHYRKNAVADPNNQMSISYVDQEGRTVATALAGGSPDNLDELPSLRNGDWDTLTVDISDKKIQEGKTMTHTHKILNVDANTEYSFMYSMSAIAEESADFGCISCSFDLEFSITDPNGRLVALPTISGNESDDIYHFEMKDIKATDCENDTTIGNIEISDLMFTEVGEYTVSKKLTANDLSLESLEQVVLNDPEVQQEIEEIRNTYVLDSAACEFCTTCDVDSMISETISEVMLLNCENIYNQIVQELKDANTGDTVYTPTSEEIEGHELYCKYAFCKKNRASDSLDAQISRVLDWNEAVNKGYDQLIDVDPFFSNSSLSGYDYKDEMQSRLNDVLVVSMPYDSDGDSIEDGVNDIRGPILEVLDFNNVDYYINEDGEFDTNGYHVLYWDLQARADEYTPSELTQKLNEQKWSLYMGLYTDLKRQVKLSMSEVQDCPALKEELEVIDELPQDEEGIKDYGSEIGIYGAVSDTQISNFMNTLNQGCTSNFNSTDSTLIANRLKIYFDKDTTNMLEYIDELDLSSDSDLIAIEDIMSGYGCGLDEIAMANPVRCLRDTVIMVPYTMPSPILDLPFNGDANDVSGNEFHGTVNGAMLTTDRCGNANGAYLFDGVNDYISIPHNELLNTSNINFAITAWVKSTRTSSQMVFQKGGAGGPNSPQYWLRISDQWLTKDIAFVNGDGVGSSSIVTATNNPVNDGEWHFLVAQRDGDKHQIFVDGVLIAEEVLALENTDNTEEILIGAQQAWGGTPIHNYFQGEIDDIKVYDQALNQSEITYLENNCTGTVATPSPILDLPFNGDADDVSGSGLHASIYGASLTTDRCNASENAYLFDGVDDYMAIYPSGEIGTIQDFTISCWVLLDDYIDGLDPDRRQYIIDFNSDTNNIVSDSHLGYVEPGFALATDFDGSQSSFLGILRYQDQAEGENFRHYTDIRDQWTFLTMVREGSEIKIYQDGVLVITQSCQPNPLDINHPLYIGTFNGNNPNYTTDYTYNFNGKIDDIKLYDQALNQSEISYLARSCAGSTTSQPLATEGSSASGQTMMMSTMSSSETNSSLRQAERTFYGDGSQKTDSLIEAMLNDKEEEILSRIREEREIRNNKGSNNRSTESAFQNYSTIGKTEKDDSLKGTRVRVNTEKKSVFALDSLSEKLVKKYTLEIEKYLKEFEDSIRLASLRQYDKRHNDGFKSLQLQTMATTTSLLPNQEEYDALIALYNATGGPNWTNNQGWVDADPNVIEDVSGWYGVGVDINGNITSLNLAVNHLQGSIPIEIGDLTNLTALWMYGNELTGYIPPQIGNLVNLNVLYLSSNELLGPIPSEIGLLSNLDFLGLSGNNLNGSIPPEIGNLSKLTNLILGSNNLSGSLPPELGNLNNLTQLSITNTQISGQIPFEFSQLSNLKYLLLYNNNLNGAIPKEIGFLTNLETLILNGNQLIGSIPPEFGDLISLRDLRISANSLSGNIPEELGNLLNLESLHLFDNELNGEIPSELGGLGSLKELYLFTNNLSGVIPSELGGLSSLKSLLLINNLLSSSIPPELGNLNNLEQLILSENNLEGSIPSELGNLQNLNELYLSNNNLSGTIPSELGNLSNVSQIQLSYNELEGNLPIEISNCVNLSSLSFRDNNLHGNLPISLVSIESLNFLTFDNNRFTFSDFLNLKNEYSGNLFEFAPQDSIDEEKEIAISLNEELILTTNIDRNTIPKCKYQWFKDGVAVTSLDTANHTFIITNVSAEDVGDYHYIITNDDAPDLTLTSKIQHVTIDGCGSTSTEEIAALIQLYEITNGDEWINNSGWKDANGDFDTANVSNWYGITQDQCKRINAIQLGNNNLTGDFSQWDVTGLERIEKIWLNGNQLYGDLHQWQISSITTIKQILLNDNEIAGDINLWNLNSLYSLTHLSLHQNQISGVLHQWDISQLSDLTSLLLNDNNISGDIKLWDVSGLSSIASIYLHNNLIGGDLSQWDVSNLDSLKNLLITNNNISGDISNWDVTSISNLVTLWLNGNEITGNLSQWDITSHPNLTSILLDGNQLFGDLSQWSLSGLSNISSLWLDDNQLSGDLSLWDISDLTNLRVLLLDNNQLSGSLANLDLSNNDLIRELHLNNNLLSGDLNQWNVSNLSELEKILIKGNLFTFKDIIPFKDNGITTYAPQQMIDSTRNYVALEGNSFILTTNIDRNTSTPCKYQWFKDGIEINTLTVDNHTYTIPNVSESDAGTYHYIIKNDDAPDLTLTSHPIHVTVEPNDQNGNPKVLYHEVSICLEYDLNNPAYTDNFTLDYNLDDVVQLCLERQQKTLDTIIYQVKEKLIEERMSSILKEYHQNCLDNVTETLNYTYSPKEYHYTLYYYDQAGNLTQTVPPKGVKPLSKAEVDDFIDGTAITEPAHELPTRYRYNSLNQLTWQNSPDGGTSQFWYDKKGQLRFSQNEKQLADDKYSYTKYDQLGRITEVGELLFTGAQEDLLVMADSADFPQSDSYNLNDITNTVYDIPAPEGLISIDFDQQNLRNRVSYVFVRETSTSDSVATYYSYDAHGNVHTLVQDIPGTGEKRTDYVYDLISGNVNMVMYQYGQPDQFFHRYQYDADNRLETVETSHDGYIWSRDAKYYYYPHGPLSRIELGEHNVQGLDYYYTLQGWIKGVNMPVDGDPGEDGTLTAMTGKDEFAYNLGYFNGDYNSIGNGIVTPGSRDQLWSRYNENRGTDGLYNGNISWMATHLPEAGRRNGDKGYQAMLYHYDQLNRIMSSSSLTQYSGTGFAGRTGGNEAYDTRYTYDPNGNLMTLQRYDSQGSLKDDFDYEYFTGTNQLKKVVDVYTPSIPEHKSYNSNPLLPDSEQYRHITLDSGAVVPSGNSTDVEATESITINPGVLVESGASFTASIVTPQTVTIPDSGQYVYDEIGNLVRDNGEGTTIEWTPYGKVRSVTKDNGDVMSFRYDASGNRTVKSITTSDTTLTTFYIRDASGNVMATYVNEALKEQPIYGSSRVGMYKGNAKAGQEKLGLKRYELSNHLGNVLAVITDNINIDTTVRATVASVSDYYPFGLQMNGRTFSADTYRYGFNGKEKDDNGEWGQTHYDYGFRIYNPSIAKFLSVDPLTKKYPMLTPYQFASNRPIDGIDLDGLEFFSSTFYDLTFNIYKISDKDIIIDVRPIRNDFAVQNSGLVKLIERNRMNLGYQNSRKGLGMTNTIINDSRGELYSTAYGLGRVLSNIGRVTAYMSIADRVASDIETLNKKALILNSSRLNEKFNNDYMKAQWFGNFLSVFSKSKEFEKIGFESIEEFGEFINFAFDDKRPHKEKVTDTGFVILLPDRKKLNKFIDAYKIMEDFYEQHRENQIMYVDEGNGEVKRYDFTQIKAKPDDN